MGAVRQACVRTEAGGKLMRNVAPWMVRSEEKQMVERRLNLGRNGDSNSSSVAGQAAAPVACPAQGLALALHTHRIWGAKRDGLANGQSYASML